MSTEELIGEVTHYFSHVSAAVIKLTQALSQGETIHFKGHSTDFTQQVTSMQFDRKPVTSAESGQDVGIQITARVRTGDKVFRVSA